MRTLLILLLLLPHAAIFIYAGITELRAWRRLDPATRPSFVAFLGRIQGTADQLSPIRRMERGETLTCNAAAATAKAARDHRARTARAKARRAPQPRLRVDAPSRDGVVGRQSLRPRPDARAGLEHR